MLDVTLVQEDGTIVHLREDGVTWISDGKPVYKIEGGEVEVYIYEDGKVKYGNLPIFDDSNSYYSFPYCVPIPVFLANYYREQEGGEVIPLTDHYRPIEDYYPTPEEIEEEKKAREKSGAIV